MNEQEKFGSKIFEFGNCSQKSDTICLKFEKGKKSEISLESGLIFKASYKTISHKNSLLEEFDQLFQKLTSEMLDSLYHPTENLSIQILILHSQDIDIEERRRLNSII